MQSIPEGGAAMHGEHADGELPQEVQQRFLLPGDAHPQPPGIHCTYVEAPDVDREPPFLYSVVNPTQ